MKVLINNHLCTIGWHYESRKISKAIAKKKINAEDLKGLTKKEIADKLGLKAYPLPDSTHCIIEDTVTGDRYTGSVRRYHMDPWDREEARKRALTKAVWQLFPQKEDKEASSQRKKFWDAYRNRIVVDPKNNIKKCIKKGLFSLKDLADYANDNHVVTFVKSEEQVAFSIH